MTQDDESAAGDSPGDDRGHPPNEAPADAADPGDYDATGVVDEVTPRREPGAFNTTQLIDPAAAPDQFGGTQLMGEVVEAKGMDGTVLVAQPDFDEETPARGNAVPPFDGLALAEPDEDETPTPPSAVVAVADDVVAVVPAPLVPIEPEQLEELEPEPEDDERPTLTHIPAEAKPASAPTSAVAPEMPEGETVEQLAPTSIRTAGAFGPLPFGVPTKGPDPDATRVADKATAVEQPAAPPARAKAPMPSWVKVLAVLAVAGGPLGYAAVRGLRTKKAPAPPSTAPAVTAKASAHKPAPVKQPKKATPPPKASAAPTASAAIAEPAPAPERAADLGRCVMGAFPQDDVPAELPDLALVCDETDAREVIKKISILMVAGKGLGAAAKREWVKLGWYRMARMQLLRTKCCGDVPPLTSIAALSACGLDDAFAAFAAAAGDGTAISAAADDYDKAVNCLFKAQASRMFRQRRRPSGFERQVFRDSLAQD